MEGQDTRLWVIHANLAEIDPVCVEISDWLAQLMLQDYQFALEIIAREALCNAILHGAQQDSSQPVSCELQITPERICLTVTDPGPGFDWQARLHAGPPDVSAEHGRGLLIYQLYADEVKFSSSGNRVELHMQLHSK